MKPEHDKMKEKNYVQVQRKDSSVQIANPIYDVVFKFLLDDNRIARKFLSLLTGKKIVSLEYCPTELRNTLNKEASFTVLRIDFSAVVELEDGTKEHIIIELQKAFYFADIQRFRRYLGTQYANPENTYVQDGKKKAMSIYTIYFLGKPLKNTTAPLITANTVVRDKFTGEIIEDDEEFIDALTHEGLYIQMPYLKDKRRNEIEKVLSVFDVTQGKTHFFDIDEHEYPEEHQDIIRRLRQACSEKQIRDTMICEDEVLAELADMERAIANKDKELDEKDKKINEKDKELGEKDKELSEKDKELNSQKKEHAATLQRAVKKLAKAMDISEDEASKMLTS